MCHVHCNSGYPFLRVYFDGSFKHGQCGSGFVVFASRDPEAQNNNWTMIAWHSFRLPTKVSCTAAELEAMAATVISPTVDAAYQSGCHTASVWDKKAQVNIPRLMSFMNDFGLITGRDPDGEYHAMTDVIHKVLNDLTVDDWDITIGGDSHTRMSKGVAFGADSGTVALARLR